MSEKRALRLRGTALKAQGEAPSFRDRQSPGSCGWREGQAGRWWEQQRREGGPQAGLPGGGGRAGGRLQVTEEGRGASPHDREAPEQHLDPNRANRRWRWEDVCGQAETRGRQRPARLVQGDRTGGVSGRETNRDTAGPLPGSPLAGRHIAAASRALAGSRMPARRSVCL